MGVEIERKFLVASDAWRQTADAGTAIEQGYLARGPQMLVRVRLAGDNGWLTLKERTAGPVRAEYEYPIPAEDARALLALCAPHVLRKRRHRLPAGALCWEIDVFEPPHKGLVMAEIELADPDQGFARPAWLGREVTSDPAYTNAALAGLDPDAT